MLDECFIVVGGIGGGCMVVVEFLYVGDVIFCFVDV